MSAACCPIPGNDDYAEKYWVSQPVAAKDHTCCECSEAIPVGTRHELYKLMADSDFSAYRTCLLCVEIRSHFACNGWTFTTVWEDLETYFFPEMKAGGPCMEGLSVAAKMALFEARTAWVLDGGHDGD